MEQGYGQSVNSVLNKHPPLVQATLDGRDSPERQEGQREAITTTHLTCMAPTEQMPTEKDRVPSHTHPKLCLCQTSQVKQSQVGPVPEEETPRQYRM